VTSGQLIDAFVERLDLELDATVDETHRRMALAVPSLDIVARPEIAAAAEASSRGSLRAVLSALQARGAPHQVPPEPLREARLCARLGIPVDDLLQTYRVAHEQILGIAIEVFERAPATAEDRAEALRAVARSLYGYLDLVSTEIPKAYAAAGAARGDRLLADVRRVLAGDRDELEAAAYDLRAAHVGVVAWGPAAAEALSGAVAEDGVVVEVGEEVAWAWTRRATTLPTPPPGVRFALGNAARGAHGFRRTHAEALRAQAVAVRTRAQVARYADVAVEWLAVTDPAAARGFVEAELGELAAGGAREARMRETLAAYLGAGQSRAAAAAALGVADRTVAYRIRTAEERLGRPVYARATELAIALRWAALLDDGEPLPDSAT